MPPPSQKKTPGDFPILCLTSSPFSKRSLCGTPKKIDKSSCHFSWCVYLSSAGPFADFALDALELGEETDEEGHAGQADAHCPRSPQASQV